jgi:amino acid transporter
MSNGQPGGASNRSKDCCLRRTQTVRHQAKQGSHQSMDWNRIFGTLLILAGVAGSAVALVYAWTIQMMLRYARHDLMDGFWIFLICFAGLLVSVLVGYVGVRMLRQPQA